MSYLSASRKSFPRPEIAPHPRWWCYALPNLLTMTGLTFGMLGIESAVRGRPIAAAWWGLYCTLTDKLDGAAARRFGGSSRFGFQLDSLADLVTFGVLPPTVLYTFFLMHPALGWSSGGGRMALEVLSVAYLLAAAARLARFNVLGEDQRSRRNYLGVPSTMAAGIVLSLFIAGLKYSHFQGAESAGGLISIRLLGDLQLDGLLRCMPIVLGLFGVGMLMPLEVPRLGSTGRRLTDVLLLSAVVLGYSVGLCRSLPEYLALAGLAFLGLALTRHITRACRSRSKPSQLRRS